jgi:hypothetical protein
MKSENSKLVVGTMSNADEHDLFHLFKTAKCIKVTSNIPVKEELTPLELSVFNFLLNLSKEQPFHHEEFTLELLRDKLIVNYSDDELVEIFRNLDKKYYTECAFDDQGVCVWIKLL